MSSFVRAENGVRVGDYGPVVHSPTLPLKSRELEAVRNRRKGPVVQGTGSRLNWHTHNDWCHQDPLQLMYHDHVTRDTACLLTGRPPRGSVAALTLCPHSTVRPHSALAGPHMRTLLRETVPDLLCGFGWVVALLWTSRWETWNSETLPFCSLRTPSSRTPESHSTQVLNAWTCGDACRLAPPHYFSLLFPFSPSFFLPSFLGSFLF